MDASVRFLSFSPPPPLDACVSMMWYWEGVQQPHRKESVVAAPGTSLLINLAEDRLHHYGGPSYAEQHRLRGIAISGPSTRHFAIDAFHPKIMGVAFKPGGARPFFRTPAAEFRNAHIALEDLWGPDAGRLHLRLVEAATPDAKFRILCRALMQVAKEGFGLHPAVDFALRCFERAPHLARVGKVAAEIDMSHRRFIELFTRCVGVTPKLYLRLTRFERVLNESWTNPSDRSLDWATIAHTHGYSDQSHLIRDFKEFTGLTPTLYLARRGAGPKHNALPD